MHPAFIGAQYPFSVATGAQPPMAATAVTFPGVPVPSMTQIAVHPYHPETGLPLSTTLPGQKQTVCHLYKLNYISNLDCDIYCTLAILKCHVGVTQNSWIFSD